MKNKWEASLKQCYCSHLDFIPLFCCLCHCWLLMLLTLPVRDTEKTFPFFLKHITHEHTHPGETTTWWQRGSSGSSLMTQLSDWWRAGGCYHAVVAACCSLLLSAAVIPSHVHCGDGLWTCPNSSASCPDYYFHSYCSRVFWYVVVRSVTGDLLWKRMTHSHFHLLVFYTWPSVSITGVIFRIIVISSVSAENLADFAYSINSFQMT